jgi:glycosyltransferase involved in cell wall biosynthesis
MPELSILYVSYPLLTVTPESAGGAEQMLLAVERQMHARGYRTTVAASRGSRVRGDLLDTGLAVAGADQYEQREREHSAAILSYLGQHPDEFDLIHDKSGSFFRYAAQCPVPVLATLHLPRSFYREEFFRDAPQNLYFNCVSQSQAESFRDLPNFLGVVENGIDTDDFPFTTAKENYVLWLGRICEEKGPHLAIAAAQKAGMPLVLAGQVYPFRYHQDFFAREIQPYLSDGCNIRFVDTPTHAQKLDLLSHARALLLTSTAEETSSLVAMEAMACGTPVVAFRRGAFPEVVADGETGFVVESIEEMAQALGKLDRLSPEACRTRVQRHFSASRMAQDYQELYRRVLMSANEAEPCVADRIRSGVNECNGDVT